MSAFQAETHRVSVDIPKHDKFCEHITEMRVNRYKFNMSPRGIRFLRDELMNSGLFRGSTHSIIVGASAVSIVATGGRTILKFKLDRRDASIGVEEGRTLWHSYSAYEKALLKNILISAIRDLDAPTTRRRTRSRSGSTGTRRRTRN